MRQRVRLQQSYIHIFNPFKNNNTLNYIFHNCINYYIASCIIAQFIIQTLRKIPNYLRWMKLSGN